MFYVRFFVHISVPLEKGVTVQLVNSDRGSPSILFYVSAFFGRLCLLFFFDLVGPGLLPFHFLVHFAWLFVSALVCVRFLVDITVPL